ncbi:patatin-like phospholipase family protein [Ideonella sp. B7]|uniref:patatin-like phospholipase family protein n=1 Tax=Ideonella benzenivorans TaxID=2831643 RepID=UPI001CEC594F|nr:patatin-like phospholipase family protein [Ideonella benzenivorans]MCA6217814.1 patatin-like phospholipase family protein [Ideonella benzenivorans]
MPSTPVRGLVLTGGGARAAYQVGVLQALNRLRHEAQLAPGNPFQVITGTSAGGINAAALACSADDVDRAIQSLAEIWSGLHVDQVYRSDALGMIRTGARWLTMMSIGWVIARWVRQRPRSLLDNQPLGDLLRRMVALERLEDLLAEGHLRALAVTASSYSSGVHATFYQVAADSPQQPWVRSQRMALPCQFQHEHLLASAAIPFVFPAQALALQDRLEWFGDGSMRQTAPVSPAVHLGAERVLVIGAGRMHEPTSLQRPVPDDYPSVAQIGGHVMSSIFLDALSVDVERLRRINHTLGLLPAESRRHTPLRPVELLVIAPSQRLDDIAARHLSALPLSVRALLGGVGVEGEGSSARGAALASYLLFEADFTQELIRLGEADTLAQREAVLHFLRPAETADSVAG